MFGDHQHHHDHRPSSRDERRCGPRDGEGGRGFGRGPWSGGAWGRGGGHRGGHRGGRPFDQGDLRLLLLDLIAEKPRHGYELIKAIEQAMDGHYSPSPGVVYPTLTLLEETGLIAAETQGAKKLYSLTSEGQAALDTEAEAVKAAKGRMQSARERFGPPPAAEIGRAMQNLGSALAVRLSKGPLSKEELRRVTDVIDTAARGVEES